ncbi:four helix bundle protein [Psychroflexus sp. CAK8W]|uniref:Four helix bundle protein n=1 Tax=Psychroflexus longus TaxID=2873596 RepID=A0ABS7XNK9_9FLAO|nr:four helix bundle protein [Psychroflexus longus]MBZ9779451.1 four helix bundle protein [Psychroflexus longus]
MGHKDMDVWKESMVLVKMIYKMTSQFPKSEAYGLTSQLRRAAVSIPTNIAEGSARNGLKELHQFIGIAMGSASEVDTLIIIAKDLDYTANDIEPIEKQLNLVRKLLVGYKRYIKTKI